MSAAGDEMDAVADEPLLRVAITRKIYRRSGLEPVEAVRDLAFAIRKREIACLIGPSGAGKTTTLRIILGLDRDFEGQVTPDPDRAKTTVVFQEPRLMPWRTVEQNVRLGLPRLARGRSLDELFAALSLQPWRSHYPNALSLGMQRRVALARALASEPRLLVLDEPFVSLDDAAAASLRQLVVSAVETSGASVLMVTHDIDEALTIADRLMLVSGRPATLYRCVPLDLPRRDRTYEWKNAQRTSLAASFPDVIAAP